MFMSENKSEHARAASLLVADSKYPVRERGQLLAAGGEGGGVQVGQDDAGAFGALGEHPAPDAAAVFGMMD